MTEQTEFLCLPNEVIASIFQRLSVKDLRNTRMVNLRTHDITDAWMYYIGKCVFRAVVDDKSGHPFFKSYCIFDQVNVKNLTSTLYFEEQSETAFRPIIRTLILEPGVSEENITKICVLGLTYCEELFMRSGALQQCSFSKMEYLFSTIALDKLKKLEIQVTVKTNSILDQVENHINACSALFGFAKFSKMDETILQFSHTGLQRDWATDSFFTGFVEFVLRHANTLKSLSIMLWTRWGFYIPRISVANTNALMEKLSLREFSCDLTETRHLNFYVVPLIAGSSALKSLSLDFAMGISIAPNVQEIFTRNSATLEKLCVSLMSTLDVNSLAVCNSVKVLKIQVRRLKSTTVGRSQLYLPSVENIEMKLIPAFKSFPHSPIRINQEFTTWFAQTFPNAKYVSIAQDKKNLQDDLSENQLTADIIQFMQFHPLDHFKTNLPLTQEAINILGDKLQVIG